MKTRLQLAFGQRCKDLHSRLGESQEQFALRIGMDRSYYASIEVGERNVTLTTLEKIAQGFNLTISGLLQGL